VNSQNSDPLSTALFLVIAMTAAGCMHVAWLRSAMSRRLAQPIDGGITLRGKRLFGKNKMLRGLVAMPVAAAGAFALLGGIREAAPAWLATGMWPLPAARYALLGFASGCAFMLAELPNSFAKRQLGIDPGEPPARPALRVVFFFVDRCDSVVGALVVASLLVPVQLATWLWVLALGPFLHAVFSIVLHRLGIKARAL
jgi:CDP-2,3-bis-(O-geranylgeranyl)-sn-glycerol synthase